MEQKISLSVFEDLTGADKGGALSISSQKVSIECCSFVNCSSITYGGGIYTNHCPILLKGNLFYRCFVKTCENGKYGNAICCSQCGKTSVLLSSCRLCGANPTKCGDSSIKLDGGIHHLKSINSTSNYGNGGAALASLWSSDDGNYIKYSQCIDSHDYDVVEVFYNPCLVSHVNIINCLQSSYVILANYDKAHIYLDYTNFYNVYFSAGFAYGNYTAKNCVSDVTLVNFSVKSSPTQPLYPIYFYDKQYIICKCSHRHFAKISIILMNLSS